MGEWFGNKGVVAFQVFGLHHITMIAIYLLGMAFLAFYATRLNHARKLSLVIRWGLFIILFGSEISYQTWGIINGTWNAPEFLPFQLCSIAGILTILALATKNHKLVQIVLFIGIIPSFLAVITPELHHGYPHFRFWQFFIHHIVLSWGSLFLALTTSINLTWRKTIEAYIYLLIYAAIVGFFLNPIFDANFLFLARIPSANTPLGLLGSGFWYYFNLCLVGLVVFVFIYGIYRIFIKKRVNL